MSHYSTRIANGGNYQQPRKRQETPPEDNGVSFDPMKSLKSTRNLRARSGGRSGNVQGR